MRYGAILLFPLSAGILLAASPEQAVAILEKRCFSCHAGNVSMSELKLDTRAAMLKGGTRGAAALPGNPAGSLLVQAIRFAGKLTMPPNGKLPEAEIAVLEAWIDGGAEWPSGGARTVKADWWSFRKPVRPSAPEGAGARNPIDAFLLSRLRKEGIEPAPEADRRILARRAYMDLHGVPPTAKQAKAFVEDTAPGAWERLIDELLASPRYGEKWGRHWLDLVRYGDTSGFEQDPYNLEAWRYRDYVIRSFNDDKPYDRFAKEQIAGDELWPEEAEARTGTGFYRVGPNRDMLFKVEDINRVEKLTDYVDTTSTVFLGLSVGCARCHDHKFDPIPQRDFYRMQAIFAPAINDRVFLDYNPARFYDIAEVNRNFRLRQIGDHIARIFGPYRQKLRAERIAKLPPEIQAVFAIEKDRRTPEQQALATAEEENLRSSQDEIRAMLSQEDAERLKAIERQLVSTFDGYGPPPMAPGVIDSGREAPRTYIAIRGNPKAPGEEVQPGFLTCLGGGEVPEPPLHAETTYRRKALAEWLASANNPLFARVMVNRIWQYHFGAGIVDTPSDFGTRATAPSHPELLDWLAAEFVERKWSIKAMHRLLMTSDAFRRVSAGSGAAQRLDPANRLLSHMSRRRLDAEEIRDAVLHASGELNLKAGGSPVVPPLDKEELYGIIGNPATAWPVTPSPEEWSRRSIYLLSRRTFRQPMLEAFDKPDGIASCARRNESTTAPQSLTLLNSRFMMEQSRALASKAGSPEQVWQRVYGRDPNGEELAQATGFVADQEKVLGSKEAALAELARALLNSNEFLYVD